MTPKCLDKCSTFSDKARCVAQPGSPRKRLASVWSVRAGESGAAGAKHLPLKINIQIRGKARRLDVLALSQNPGMGRGDRKGRDTEASLEARGHISPVGWGTPGRLSLSLERPTVTTIRLTFNR
ncbi:hypothetical protein J6590_037602 [Homalodisca vitripennis]|nr:hypothetical protein J6590_037602 [Homalodisca vitripennis]